MSDAQRKADFQKFLQKKQGINVEDPLVNEKPSKHDRLVQEVKAMSSLPKLDVEKFDREQAVKAKGGSEIDLLTPEEVAAEKKKGVIGIMEAASEQNKLELVPFLNAATLLDDLEVYNATQRMLSGQYDDESLKQKDMSLVTEYGKKIQREEIRGYSWQANTYLYGSTIPAMGAEFFFTGGLYTAGKTATKKVAKKGLGIFLRKSVKDILKVGSKGVASKATRGAVSLLGATVGSASRLVATPHNVARPFLGRRLSQQIQFTDKGKLVLKEANEKPATTFFKYALPAGIMQNLTEQAGSAVLKPITKFVGGKIKGSLPKKSQDILNKMFMTSANEAMPDGKFARILEKSGWSGVIEEMGEERLAPILMAVTGVDDRDISLFDKMSEAVYPGMDQLTSEFVAIGIFGGLSRAGQKISNNLRNNGYSEEEAKAFVGNLSQLEQEQHLESIETTNKQHEELLKPKIKTDHTLFEKSYRHAVNRFAPIEKLSERAKEMGIKINKGRDPKLLARQYLGIGRMITSTLEDSTYKINTDGNIEKTGEGLKPILDSIEKSVLHIENKQDAIREDLQEYLIAKRTIEDLAPRDDVKVSEADLQKSVNDLLRINEKYGEDIQLLKDASKRIYGYQTRVLENLVDSGQISKEQFDGIKGKNQNYIPFDRVIPEDTEQANRTKKGFNKAKSPIKKIKGSELEVENVYESMIKNTVDIMERAQRNRVARSIADISENFPEIAQIRDSKESVPKDLKPKGNQIEYWEDGDRKFMTVDSELYESMTGMSEQQLSLLVKMLSVPSTTLRIGATLTPDFMISNVLRDQWTAAIQTNVGFRPFIDPALGLADILGKKDMYYDWIRSGGAYSGLIETSRENLKNAYAELMGKKSLLKKMNIVTTLSDFSQVFEQATRVGIFRAAKRSGLSDVEAAFESREGTLDFARRGSSTKSINALKAFFNAGVQSFDKTLRSFKENPVTTFAKGVAYITTPTAYLYYKNRDDPEYWEIPQWRRDLFWNMKVNIGDETVWLSLPKPFGLGQIFGTLPERFAQHVDQEDPYAFDELGGTMADSLLPASSWDAMLPNAFVPVIEGVTNYKFFTGRDLVPDYLLDQEPFMQFNQGTSSTAKEIGRFLNISPAKLDNTIMSYTGSSGRYILEGTDELVNGIKRSNGEKVHEKPRDLTTTPFIRRFLKSRPYGSQSQSVQKFYDFADKLNKIKNTATSLDNSADSGYEEYVDSHEYELEMAEEFATVRREIKEMNSDIKQIIQSDFTDEEKLKQIGSIEREMTSVAEDVLKLYVEGLPK